MLATTVYDSPDASYTFSIQRSRQALTEAGIQTAYALLSGNCHVDDARNTVVQEFLLSDCTDLVFLDADVSWDEDDLVALCGYDRPIVGGVYPYRRPGMENAMPVRPVLSDDIQAGDGLIEVEGLPAGFMKVQRHVLETLAAQSEGFMGQHDKRSHVPLIFERTLEDGVRWGGDLKFCRKWRDTGGKVFAAPEMRLGHCGKQIIVDSFAACVRRANGLTLRHISALVKQGRETPGHYAEIFDSIGNIWGATPDVLAAAVAMARNAEGPILEVGSGLSTVLMAAANPDAMVWCLEHDAQFAARLEQMAGEAGVTNIMLVECSLADGWYDISDEDLPFRFAFALVDGPPRAISDRMRFFDALGDRTDLVICDDADDPGYLDKITVWAEAQGRTVRNDGSRVAVILPADWKNAA